VAPHGHLAMRHRHEGPPLAGLWSRHVRTRGSWACEGLNPMPKSIAPVVAFTAVTPSKYVHDGRAPGSGGAMIDGTRMSISTQSSTVPGYGL